LASLSGRDIPPNTPPRITILRQFKKILRMLGLVLLIILAGLGIGLAGGLPVPKLNRRDDKIEVTDESVEEDPGATLRMEKE
jgi:hypothetical protein